MSSLLKLLSMPSTEQALAMQPVPKDQEKPTDSDHNLSGSFVRLAFHSSTILDNTLFIDSGEITLNTGYTTVTRTQNKTLTVDLSTSWEASDVKYGSIDKDTSVPILNFGGSWTSSDQASLYSFGGVRSSVPHSPIISNIEIWKYSAMNGWSGLTSQSPASPTLTDTRPAFAANTYGNGVGYMLGGIRGNTNAPWWPLPGLLTYNMAENTWTNESTISAIPYGAIGGSLTFVPGFGKQGVLVAMGGEYAGSKPWMQMATNFVPFTNISIWDIASGTWYWQNTTSRDLVDTPPSATGFCNAGIAGPNGSFEIFVYGGYDDTFVLSSKIPSDVDRAAQEIFNAVYALSLPGFLWTRVNSEIASPRTGHTCEAVGNRQLLSIGGLNPTYSLQDARDQPDDFSQGFGIFDMTDLKWMSSYNASAAGYITPGIIQNWYDAGGLDSVIWSSAEVEALFNRSTNSTASLPTARTEPNTNVIVPAAIGGILGAIILGALIAFLYRRYSRKHSQDSDAPDGPPKSGDTLAGNLRTYLTRSKARYSVQRQAFIDQTTTEPTTVRNGSSRFTSPMKKEDPRMPRNSHSRSLERSEPGKSPPPRTIYRPPPLSSMQHPGHPAFSGTRSDSCNRPGQTSHHGRAQSLGTLAQPGSRERSQLPNPNHIRSRSDNQDSRGNRTIHEVFELDRLPVTPRRVATRNQGVPIAGLASRRHVQFLSEECRHEDEIQHQDMEPQELE